MEKSIQKAIENYQCCGCVNSGFTCFEENKNGGIGCGKHRSGTHTNYGKIFLGLPKGFNRLGPYADLVPTIFQTYEDYDKWNIPVWKHLNEEGHTIVRGIRPRLNMPFIDIFLEDCVSKIDCLEIKEEDIENMN